jgi:DNA-binding response OmpR family regulator
MANILVVEDYESLKHMYATVLKAGGHSVTVVSDGDEALSEATSTTYDLIMLDLLLEDISGMQFLRFFKPKEHPKTKVVVFSNISEPTAIREAMELGAVSYFTKAKYTPKEVLEAVNAVLHGSTKSKPAKTS